MSRKSVEEILLESEANMKKIKRGYELIPTNDNVTTGAGGVHLADSSLSAIIGFLLGLAVGLLLG